MNKWFSTFQIHLESHKQCFFFLSFFLSFYMAAKIPPIGTYDIPQLP